jgi:RNA polymerase sigma-70 factor (ECF subfamily)
MSLWDKFDDVELLNKAKNGNPEAFGELYQRHARAIYRFFYARLDSQLDAEDLTEEVFMRFWHSLARYQEKGVPLAAFLFSIANNTLIDHYRRSKARTRPVDGIDGSLVDEHQNPFEQVIGRMEQQELRRTLFNLKEDYRDVLIYRFFSMLSPAETAEVMNRSVGATRILQHRALAALKKNLNGSYHRDNGREK